MTGFTINEPRSVPSSIAEPTDPRARTTLRPLAAASFRRQNVPPFPERRSPTSTLVASHIAATSPTGNHAEKRAATPPEALTYAESNTSELKHLRKTLQSIEKGLLPAHLARVLDQASSEALQSTYRHCTTANRTKARIQEELNRRSAIASDLSRCSTDALRQYIDTQAGAFKELAKKELRWREEVEDRKEKQVEVIGVLSANNQGNTPARPPADYMAQLFFLGFKGDAHISLNELVYAGKNIEKLASLAADLESLMRDAQADAPAETLSQAPSKTLQLLHRHPWMRTQTKEAIQKELDNRKEVARILTRYDIGFLSNIVGTQTGALKELAEKELRRREEVEALVEKQAGNNQDITRARAPSDYLEKLFLEGFKRDATLSPDELLYAETHIEELASLAWELESLRLGARTDALAETLSQASLKALQFLHRHPWVRTKTKEAIQDELAKRESGHRMLNAASPI